MGGLPFRCWPSALSRAVAGGIGHRATQDYGDTSNVWPRSHQQYGVNVLFPIREMSRSSYNGLRPFQNIRAFCARYLSQRESRALPAKRNYGGLSIFGFA